MKADAQVMLETSHEQFNVAAKGHIDAVVVGDQLRTIRAQNHLAAAIEFQLKGARPA